MTNRVELTNGQRRGFRSANWKLFQFSNDLTSAANVVRADDKLTAFMELESATRACGALCLTSTSGFITLDADTI
jgi:hypothetical protein